MENKKHFGALETKFAVADADTATGTLTGYGAVFGNTDSYGDIIAPGAFSASLARHKAAGTMPKMLLGHDMQALPVGVWEDMNEDSYGLAVQGSFLGTSVGQDARITAKSGQIAGLSIGYYVTDFEMRNGNRIITGAELVEVSLVNMPANDLATITSVKSQEEDMKHNTADTDLLAELRELKSRVEALENKSEQKSEDDEDCDCEDDDDCECDEDDVEENAEDDNSEHKCSDQDREDKYQAAALLLAVHNIRKTWENYGQ